MTSCFRPTAPEDRHSPSPPQPPPPPPISGNPNLTTCLYHTDLGLFSLTWSRTFLGRSLHLHLHPSLDYTSSPLSLPAPPPSLFSSSSSFHLHIKPFFFWRKHGSKKLYTNDHHPTYSTSPNSTATTTAPNIQIFWDLSRARFASGPEPESGFYIAVVVDGEMALLVGDSAKQAYARTKARKPSGRSRSRSRSAHQSLVLRREHVIGHRVYSTRVRFGGKTREISVNCGVDEDARLSFSVDGTKVLQIKRLKWKFRGNERIEVDGVPVQVSWDVYNWLFDDACDAHAVFMFRFEKSGNEDEEDEEEEEESVSGQGHAAAAAVDDKIGGGGVQSCSFGMNGVELRKMRRSFLRSSGARSSSSSSMSSASSSGCSSSVMEWASTEENDQLSGPTGFSLLVYAWRK